MATLIKPDGSETIVKPRGKYFKLKELQNYVGGFIQLLTLPNGNEMYVNEDGKSLHLLINHRATLLGHVAGIHDDDFIVGTVLICDPTETKK